MKTHQTKMKKSESPVVSHVSLESRVGPCDALGHAAERGEVALHSLARECYPGRKLRPDMLPGLLTVGYWDARQTQSWGLDWHRHNGLEIEFQETGRMDLAVNGERRFYEVNPGQITIMRPWQLHRYGRPHIEKGRLHWMILDVGAPLPNRAWKFPDWVVLSRDDQAELERLLRHSNDTIMNTNAAVRRCFLNLAKTVVLDERKRLYSRLSIQLNELLLCLLDLFQSERLRLDDSLTSPQRAVELFLDSLRHNLAELRRPWTVKCMAKECGLGQTLFSNCCKACKHQSPCEFLRIARLEAGRTLLENQQDVSVAEVAQLCGFTSSEYFITSFRMEFGVTPKVFRKLKV